MSFTTSQQHRCRARAKRRRSHSNHGPVGSGRDFAQHARSLAAQSIGAAVSLRLIVAICAAASTFSACQSDPMRSMPATLMPGDTRAMDVLRSAIAKEMGRTSIDLGPSDPTLNPVVSVLPIPPGPLDDKSLAMPTVFRIEVDGQSCSLVRESTGVRVVLDGVRCQAK